MNVVTQAQAHALAHATTVASIEQLAAQIRADNAMPDEIATDLDDLKNAVVTGEEKVSLLARLGAIAEKAKPFVDLAPAVASLANQVLG